MKKDSYLDYLAKVPLFEAFSKKDLGHLARLAETVDVSEGKELIKEGATGREFFVIAEGKASVLRKGRKVATLGPGAHFGELSLLDGCPRNSTVRAETDMRVVVLGQREFLGLLDQVPTMDIKLMKAMARRLREADEKAVQ